MLDWATNLDLAEPLRVFLLGFFPIVQSYRPGQANGLALAEALRMFPCRFFPYGAAPYAGLGE